VPKSSNSAVSASARQPTSAITAAAAVLSSKSETSYAFRLHKQHTIKPKTPLPALVHDWILA